jgi:hypothetical protein
MGYKMRETSKTVTFPIVCSVYWEEAICILTYPVTKMAINIFIIKCAVLFYCRQRFFRVIKYKACSCASHEGVGEMEAQVQLHS